MASESSLFDDYGAYHRDRRNLICHEIGIPLIVLGIIALLRLVALPGWNLNLAEPVLAATAVYYLTLGSAVRTSAFVAIVGMIALYLIAAYVTYFPVTVNTLKGLRSVDPNALALMTSLAASRRQIYLMLRIPTALPYIFQALKIAATASVIGAQSWSSSWVLSKVSA